jgi:hypothetical protein
MGVRPPTGGSADREAVEFGIAALAPELEESDLEFPATVDEIVRTLGDPAVPVDASGRSLHLSTAFEDVDTHQFDSERELLNALHPVFESYRETVSAGWLDSLRQSLPF